MNELAILDQRELLGQNFIMYGNIENPLFLAKDVAEWIGHSDTSKMLNAVDEDEKLMRTLFASGQKRQMCFLTEDGFYEVLMLSRKPIAKQFKKAVKEILKQIRKTGQYIDKPTPDDKIAKDLAEAKARNARAREASLYLRLGEKAANPIYRDILYSYSTKALSGEFLLPLPAAPRKTYSATEIGEMLGISANRVGRLAESNNLKTEQYGTLVWDIAPNTHKQVQSFRYYLNVLDALRELLEVA